MYIKTYFENDLYLTIKLLDKNSVRRWFDNCKYFQMSYKYEYYSDFGFLEHDGVAISKYLNNIKYALAELKNIGYTVPFTVPEESVYDQPLLNKLHRFFTYNAIWAMEDINQPNPYDPSFKFPPDFTFNDWHNIIDIINNNVHSLESYLALPKKILCDTEFYTGTLYFIPDDAEALIKVRKSLWIDFTENEINEINGPTLDYTLGLPVVLNRSILGKCYLQSYIEDDDPTADDCTGRLGSFGVFNVLTNDNRSKIYETEDFINWATQYGLDIANLHLDAQIGNVIDTNISNLNNKPKLKFIRLEFLADL